jgi:anaerobic selenocysteine-containing dehydrogenase
LKEGSLVDVRSETGEMKSLSTHAFDLPPGNVMTYYPEANILVGRELDPRSKTPSFKFVEVSIGASSSK